ncbi:MAG: hypothetical protein IPJ20_23515 [Flammeovirgaceae bacterium]|nr:hypothetical protein [Flammeovirgaceae bacterium]
MGIFNAASVSNKNTILIPQVYQNPTATNGERFRIVSKAGWTAIGSSTTRNVNPTSISYGALKLIRYPTGGYAEIVYEPASYYDEYLAADVMGGGLRVASVNISSEQFVLMNINRLLAFPVVNGRPSLPLLLPMVPVLSFHQKT